MICDFEDIYMTEEDYKAEKAPYANVKLWEEKKLSMDRAIKRFENKSYLF